MQAFAEGLGGRLPTERGRDIGVSAEVGEATARVLSAVVKTAAGVFDAAATSVALRRPDGGLDYQAAWGAGADEVVGMRLAPARGSPGACSPRASARSSRTAATTPTSPPRPRAGRATCPTR